MIHLPLQTTLKNGITITLESLQTEDFEPVRALFNTIVLEGTTYPQEAPLSPKEFADYWQPDNSYVVKNTDREILGAFYIKPNYVGRCNHIANAGFIVPDAFRGIGIGRFMGEALIELSHDRGFEAIVFNLVFATNEPSLKLWRSLDFQEIGRIPNAVRLADRRTDAVILYRSLTSPTAERL